MDSWVKLLLLTGACLAQSASSEYRLANGMCRYGNKVACCWGWTQETWGQCRPVCELGCKHGKCVGPDQCHCHPGYTGKTCNQDVNECGLKPRPCPDRCMNTLGSYKCYCLHGYMPMKDGSCKNARTCAMTNCQYGCAVMKGEVMCQCPSPGLRLAPDRRSCVDIDECVSGEARCPPFRKCVNTFGSYICRCHRGFELRYVNGKYQCTDKNLSICHDKPGSKKCKCKTDTYGRGYDCKPLVKVTIQPARPAKPRPATTSRPTTKTTTTTITPLSRTTSAKRTITTTTTIATVTTSLTTTTATSTSPPTIPTTVATTLPTTVATTLPATSTAIPTIVPTTHTPTTLDIFTLTTKNPTTNTITTPTSVTTTTITTKTTAIPSTTAAPHSSSAPSTGPLITSTLDNRIKDITQRPRGDVHIPRNTGDNSLFDLDFDIELGNTEDYAQDTPRAGSLSCSFDQGVCNWMSDGEGDLHWEAVDDPAGGRYLIVPEVTAGRSIKGARLTIPLAPPLTPLWHMGDLCLSFKHLLFGHHPGSLQVFVRKGRSHSPAIWTRTGGQGWRNTQITIWGRGLESVVLKGDRKKGRSGKIAVDDFSLNKGACSDDIRE